MPTKEQLEKLYIKEQYSIRTIASFFNIDKGKVHRLLKTYEIPLRSKKDVGNIINHHERLKKAWITRKENGNEEPGNKKFCNDVEKLQRLYLEEKKGSHGIAKEFGVTQRLIIIWLKRYNIPIRSKSEANKITKNGFKSEESHVNWVGDKVSYSALHAWVRSKLGTPMVCSHCGDANKKKYEWANISGEYRRELDDWVRLCTKCHRAFDKSKNM